MLVIYKDTILYSFQKKLTEKAKHNYFYAADTGTGKTIMSIHHYLKHNNNGKLLIVAPPAKVKEKGWNKDIKFIEKEYNIEIPFTIISYGVLAKRWHEFKDYYVIFDEAHYVKNPTSKRGKSALLLTRKSDGFCLLTATPISNGWQDSINYFLMFGYYKNKTDFMRQHAIIEKQYFGSKSFNTVVGWANEERLEKQYKEFVTSIKKRDCLDLPKYLPITIDFKPSKEYKTIKKDRVLGDVAFDTSGKLLAGLRYYANQKDKLNYLEMLVESTEENIVVFYQFKNELDSIEKMLHKTDKLIYFVNGNGTVLPEEEDKPTLKNSVTLVQYQAGAAAIELQYANVIVFYTPTYSFQDYEQAKGRIERNGQKHKMTAYLFNTKGTIEEDVWNALENKKDFSEKRFLDTKL